MARSLAEELLAQQQRCRELLEMYAECSSDPHVNVLPAQTFIRAALADSERAALEGDVEGMLRAVANLKELE